MKIICINGSPKKKGNTSLILDEMTKVFEKEKIEVTRLEIGREKIRGCIACGGCATVGKKICVQFKDEPVNEWLSQIFQADGLVIGSPVYFAGLNGTLKSFLDRAFYVSSANGNLLRHKVGAAVAALRRAGSIEAIEQINRYYLFSEMFLASGNYWSQVFGLAPGEAINDQEGLNCVRVLAENMSWLLKLINYGSQSIAAPDKQPKVLTNFIRSNGESRE